ncbi:hypothetical protein M3J09_010477 [Ascochyta lentis]
MCGGRRTLRRCLVPPGLMRCHGHASSSNTQDNRPSRQRQRCFPTSVSKFGVGSFELPFVDLLMPCITSPTLWDLSPRL